MIGSFLEILVLCKSTKLLQYGVLMFCLLHVLFVFFLTQTNRCLKFRHFISNFYPCNKWTQLHVYTYLFGILCFL